MISARRRANEAITKKVQEQVQISQEMQQKVAKDKEAMIREAEELKRSIEEKKALLGASGEVNVKVGNSGSQLRTSNNNPLVELARNTSKPNENEEEYEYYSEDN